MRLISWTLRSGSEQKLPWPVAINVNLRLCLGMGGFMRKLKVWIF
jgi:hypothetical protein